MTTYEFALSELSSRLTGTESIERRPSTLDQRWMGKGISGRSRPRTDRSSTTPPAAEPATARAKTTTLMQSFE